MNLEFKALDVEFLEPNAICAMKLFSAFGTRIRRKDPQDITRALDQQLVNIQNVLDIAQSIFDAYSMNARNENFPRVHRYILETLIPDYGPEKLHYVPPEE